MKHTPIPQHMHNSTIRWVTTSCFLDTCQDISPQVNLERNPFGYIPHYNVPGPGQAAFPQQFIRQIPTPNQGGSETLRQLAFRYLYRPDAQVEMVSMEAEVTGRIKVVIVLESDDIF
jgi:hypothetical protein